MSDIAAIAARAFSSTARVDRDGLGLATLEPVTLGKASSERRVVWTSCVVVAPAASTRAEVVVPCWSSSAAMRWAGSVCGCPAAAAARTAAEKASWALVVSCRSMGCGYSFTVVLVAAVVGQHETVYSAVHLGQRPKS